MNKRCLQLMVCMPIALVVSALSSFAVTFQLGDVFAAVGNGQVQHYNSSLTLLETLNTTRGGFTTGMAFDSSGSLYVTNFSDGSVTKFDVNGALVSAQFVSGINSAPESIVFDNSGNFYVGSADGNRDVNKYNAAGVLQQSFNVGTTARGSDWIDLSADGKTLFYTSENFEVKRFDLVNNVQLTDFALLADRPAFALRVLPDGGVLVADSVNIKRLNAAGATIQTYDVAGNNNWFSLNVDPDGTSFWSGDYGTGLIQKFDIASGTALASKNTGSSSLFGVTVFGERTVVVPPTNGVPDAGSTLVLLLLAVPACIGLHLRRRRSH